MIVLFRLKGFNFEILNLNIIYEIVVQNDMLRGGLVFRANF